MLTELELQKEIKSKLIALGHSCWQVDSGKKVTYKTRGIGLEKGFPDLFGARKNDGRLFFIEVKIGNGKPSENQIEFLKVANEKNVLNGIAWNFEQALAIVEGERTIEAEESK